MDKAYVLKTKFVKKLGFKCYSIGISSLTYFFYIFLLKPENKRQLNYLNLKLRT